MLKKLEELLFGKVIGRVIARGAVSAVAGLAAFLAGHGVELTADQQTALVGLAISGANSAYTAIKDWRDKRAKAAKKAIAQDAPAA